MATTFDIFKRILSEAVSADDNLSSTQIAEILARVDALTSTELLELGAYNADAVSSTDVTISDATDSITVADGDAGTVVYSMHSFDTTVRVLGTYGVIGALIGTVGSGSNDPVENADITLQYRLSSGGDWRAFGRTVVLSDVEQIQIRASVALQAGDHDVPKFFMVCEQQ